MIVTVQGQNVEIDEEFLPTFNSYSWRINSDGYVVTRDNGLDFLHNLVLGRKEDFEVDHQDRNKLNCRKDNLRHATISQNRANKTAQTNNWSGYKGVYLCTRTGNWYAQIQVNKKARRLGTYKTPEEAAARYNRAAVEAFGEFACLNVIPSTAPAI